MLELIKKLENNHILSKDELLSLLENNKFDEEIFAAANRVRQKYVGDDVHLRGLLEFSNICSQNCGYCGLRCNNKKVQRYRLEPQEIIEIAKQGALMGYKTIVMQSGEDSYFDTEKMVFIISEIKKFGVAVTLGLGNKSFDEYKAYKDAGADRYLLRIETTDRVLYQKITGRSGEDRAKCLTFLKELGYEVGSGCLVGMPGQTLSSMADDILFFKEIDADMIGVGPFIPHPDTPLKNAASGSVHMAFKVMALIRLMQPDINIPATTAMETVFSGGRCVALNRGANVIMPNINQVKYRDKYEIYPGKAGANQNPIRYKSCVEKEISSIGRKISSDLGFRVHNFK